MRTKIPSTADVIGSTAMFVMLCVAPDAAALPDDDGIDLGGAVRLNLGWRDYGPGSRNGRPELELLRIDAAGRRGPAIFSLQYRWYDGFDAVHHAWAGWALDADRDLRVGVQQVPFGLLPYASQSFWFGSGYYLGIEDDYDLGVVYRDERGDRSWHAGVMVRDEYGTGANYDRYSFDVATTETLPYREVEHAVLRYARRFERGDWALEWGASGMLGRIEDRTDGSTFSHVAAALHLEAARGPWTLQGQWAHYDYDVPGERIALSAFMFPFEVAARADVLSVNLVRDFDVSGSWLDSLRCYNNLSTTRVSGTGLADSWQNVTGCSIGKGPMFTYFDWIVGRNMWFVGGPGIGISEPGGETWRSRLNVNVGFYF
jgi:hypothetical protein